MLLFGRILRNDITSVNESQILKRRMQMFILQKAELTLMPAPHILSALQEVIAQEHDVID